jgi:DNA invertase Pin-like site-specific DNA recombinase
MFIHMTQNDSKTPTRYVAYFRVSTKKQGAEGLGIAAQKSLVARFVEQSGGEVINAYTEVESGGKNDRKQLALAMKQAKKEGATLLVGKLDRLGRNLAFIASLMESDTPFVACDFPQADRLMLHMLAAFAEHERRVIGQRVKAALAQAKIRGVKLGTTINQINGKGRDAQRTAAQERAEQLGGIITPMRESGATLRQIAATLTAQGIKTPRSGNWSAATVRAVLVRL